MTKKSFFKERSVNEIRKLSVIQVNRQRGLVDRIDKLNPLEEFLEIRAQLILGRFHQGMKTNAQSSRKAYKHGDLIRLSQPETQEEAYQSREIPLAIRARDFGKLQAMREEDINYVGYSFRAVQGRDRTKRVVPFVWLPEGIRLFGYAENNAGGIKVRPYSDSRRVRREGASVTVSVPSRTRKHSRYQFRLMHVPVIRSVENLASVLGLKPSVIQDEETGEPIEGRTLHDVFNIKYTWETQREGSDVITFYPHDVAAYIGIVKSEWEKHNLTPLEMNPFALPSRKQADFYKKLCNNVLIYDPLLRSKNKLRKLHLAEKCILLARAIGKFGHDEFAFWDGPRDGRLRDYDWRIFS